MIFSDKKEDTLWYLNNFFDFELIWMFNRNMMSHLFIFDSFYNKNLSNICYN